MFYGDGITPLAIRDEEELERLAGLQLRDSLVRGLGVSEHLQASLKGGVCPAYSASSVDSAKSDLFTCRYHLNQEHNPEAIKHHLSHTPSEYEQRVLGMTRTTPLHNLPLPESLSTAPESCTLLQPPKPQLNNWPNSKPNLHSLHRRCYHTHNSMQSSSAPQYKPSPSRPNRFVQYYWL